MKKRGGGEGRRMGRRGEVGEKGRKIKRSW